MQESRVIAASAYRRERWKNGAGWTREIHAHPGTGGGAWAWRLSVAEIEQDAPFSVFPGIDRELVLLEGNGLRLRFDDGRVETLLPPHDRLRFPGERALVGELVDGATRDFNLMWRRDTVDAQLWHRPMVGSMAVFVSPGETWAVHMIAGAAEFRREDGLPPIAAGDTALLVAGSRRRFLIDGAGEALLVRLSQRPQ